MKIYPRIVFIVPSLKSGGAERVIVTLSNWLSQEFHVEIWMMIDSQVEYALSDKVYLNQSYTAIKKGGIIRLFWLIKHLKTEKKTIVISFMTKLNLLIEAFQIHMVLDKIKTFLVFYLVLHLAIYLIPYI